MSIGLKVGLDVRITGRCLWPSDVVVNKLRAGIKVCAVKAPGFGGNRKDILQDIAFPGMPPSGEPFESSFSPFMSLLAEHERYKP